MFGRLTNCAETSHQKGEGHRPGCNVRPVNHQLESGSIGPQHQVLAAAGVDEDVLEARQGRDKNTPVLNARGSNGLSDGRKHRRTGLWQPDVTRFQCGERWVGESTRAPTLQQAAPAPASA